MIFFSDIFNVDESIIEEYGALNISLVNDLPLFIDPFLLYASEKQEYQDLHQEIIDYLLFLREKAKSPMSPEKINRWYRFPEVKQNWLGYSECGNTGSGLGSDFGKHMSRAMQSVFANLGNESITESSHLEKISLFRMGVGRDNISDFTCNLIKHFLLEYTQRFAQMYLNQNQCRNISVSKVVFNYQQEVWRPQTYYLPYFNDDYIILTPKDLLTKDENWINLPDLKNRFLEVADSIPNIELRDKINDLYRRYLPRNPKAKEKSEAAQYVIDKYPQLMDYYIKLQESDKEGAKKASNDIVKEAKLVFVNNVQHAVEHLKQNTDFYNLEADNSYEATRSRVMFLKSFIEDKDGYRLFWHNGKPITREKDLQLIFKLTWYGTAFDVNAEVNNGRGPVDYKISNGSKDKTLVEFKLASNSKLKKNLQNQVAVYELANDTKHSMKVIIYFNDNEFKKVNLILNELNQQRNHDIILIDACNNKQSASNL